jgi:hypothetical protein
LLCFADEARLAFPRSCFAWRESFAARSAAAPQLRLGSGSPAPLKPALVGVGSFGPAGTL